MDTLFCDELLQEIFLRLPPPSSAAVSLVSRRWRRLLRSSTTSLSVHFPPPYTTTTIASFSAFLTQHPFLLSLSISGEDPLLLAVAATCRHLRRLRLLSPPVSALSLSTLSTSCLHLSSIAITISRPLCFHWLPYFKTLKSLTLFITNPLSETDNSEQREVKGGVFDVELGLESVFLSGLKQGDDGVSYIWRNCKKVKKLQLKSCESVGDYSSFSGFLKFSIDLQELELRTCRSIVDIVLLTLAERCVSLGSLLIYDGGSKEGLLQFINQSKCSLTNLDLRLPLDLDNTHLTALSENLNFRGLISLRLQSCCLVTGEGLSSLGRAIGDGLEELALVNCDVVEREPGLLTTLGQNLKRLRKLDLSYNDTLFDKELVSMLASCSCLVEMKLRGCHRLTNASLNAVVKSCKNLQCFDVTYCSGVDVAGIELFVLNSPRLRRVEVEERKVSLVARRWALSRFIEVVS